jgi:lysophospholipid acyltransferase (LPLAT)-like uncharacterized protein
MNEKIIHKTFTYSNQKKKKKKKNSLGYKSPEGNQLKKPKPLINGFWHGMGLILMLCKNNI